MAADALAARGVGVEAVRWDACDIDWPAFHAVVIRSTWDYHLNPARYRQWLHDRQADGANLWNPPAAVMANLHKGYLSTFETRGIPIVPTAHLPARTSRRNIGVSSRTISPSTMRMFEQPMARAAVT